MESAHFALDISEAEFNALVEDFQNAMRAKRHPLRPRKPGDRSAGPDEAGGSSINELVAKVLELQRQLDFLALEQRDGLL